MSEDPFDDEEIPGGEPPWLREMVDEDLLDLFSDDEDVVRRRVRSLIEEAEGDSDIEGRLIDLLQTAIDLGNDDSQAALWTSIILGEIRSVRAVGTLIRSLASDDDEALQDAAHVAILRIGAPAVESLMEAIDSDEDPRLGIPGYDLLGSTGFLGDEELRSRIVDFLESRIEAEIAHPSRRGSVEALCLALAYLGGRDQVSRMKTILIEDFRGRNVGIREAIEILEENAGGEPIPRDPNPWETRYGWLFEDEEPRSLARRARRPPGGGEDGGAGESSGRQAGSPRSDLSMLYWGLHASASSDDEPDEDLDARRFPQRPRG